MGSAIENNCEGRERKAAVGRRGKSKCDIIAGDDLKAMILR